MIFSEMDPRETRLLVIGLGWLGSAFAQTMQQKNWVVAGTTRTSERRNSLVARGLRAERFQLGDPLPKPIVEMLPQASVLLTIPPSRQGLDPEGFLGAMGTLVSSLVEGGAGRVLFTSSTSVYPSNTVDAREETARDLPSPRSGVSMLRVEEAVLGSCGIADGVIVRFGGLFGPGREPGGFFENRPLKQPSHPVNLIHLRDCLGVLETCLAVSGSRWVLNACAPEHPTKVAFYTAAAAAAGRSIHSIVPETEPLHGKVVNVEKLEKLGYRFIYPNPLDGLGALGHAEK